MSNTRDSRFEMIRLVAILMVTCHHLLIFGAGTCGYGGGYNLEDQGFLGPLLNSFLVCGVNIFILISGWWGIRRLWRPLLMLLLSCLAFGTLAWCFDSLLTASVFPGFWTLQAFHRPWDIGVLCESIKFTQWWFVVQYALLVLFAPLVEHGLRHLEGEEGRNVHRYALVGLALASCLFGWFGGYISSNGYSVVNFLLLYVAARYLRLWNDDEWTKRFYRYSGWIALVCAVILWAGFVWVRPEWSCLAQWRRSTLWWAYSNPLVVVESLAVFAWLARHLHGVQAYSSFVNHLALPVFGIYLIQSSVPFYSWRNVWAQMAYHVGGYPLLFVEALMFFAALWLVSYPVTLGINLVLSLLKTKQK